MGFLPAMNVVIAGIGDEVAYYVLYKIAEGSLFGSNQFIRLRLLETPSKLNIAKTVAGDLKSCAYPLLEEVIATSEPPQAFKDADFALLSSARGDASNKMAVNYLIKNVKIFRNHGIALELFSKRSVKVVVCGKEGAALYNCCCLSVCSKSAPSIPKENFTAVSRTLLDWAKIQISSRLNVDFEDISNALLWGNCWGRNFYPDMDHATVTLPPEIAGLKPRVLSVREAIQDDHWLKDNVKRKLEQRQQLLVQGESAKFHLSSCLAIIRHVQALWSGSCPCTYTSMAVFSDGSYGIPEGLVLSLPVLCENKTYKIVELPLEPFVEITVKNLVKELKKEQDLALHLWQQEQDIQVHSGTGDSVVPLTI